LNRSVIKSPLPKRFTSAANTRNIVSDVPPSSKKLSVVATCATASASCQIAMIARSVSLPGGASESAGRAAGAAAGRGSGRLRRSTFPLGVRGSASTTTTMLGSMYSGSTSRSAARTSPGDGCSPGADTAYATSVRSSPLPSRTTATPSATPGQRRTAASISSSSMRNPRSFT
jgi:hypothetical protein